MELNFSSMAITHPKIPSFGFTPTGIFLNPSKSVCLASHHRLPRVSCSVSTTTDSPKLVTSTKVSFLFVGFAEMMCCLDVFDKNWR